MASGCRCRLFQIKIIYLLLDLRLIPSLHIIGGTSGFHGDFSNKYQLFEVARHVNKVFNEYYMTSLVVRKKTREFRLRLDRIEYLSAYNRSLYNNTIS